MKYKDMFENEQKFNESEQKIDKHLELQQLIEEKYDEYEQRVVYDYMDKFQRKSFDNCETRLEKRRFVRSLNTVRPYVSFTGTISREVVRKYDKEIIDLIIEEN